MPAILSVLATLSSVTLYAGPSVTLYMGPRPEETATYKNWVTGCDNIRNCNAVALAPAGEIGLEGADHLQTTVVQSSAHHLDPVVTIRLPIDADKETTLSLSIDGTRVAMPPPHDGKLKFTGAKGHVLLAQMRKGNRLILRGALGQILAQASLSGLTASLLRIDAQQGKDGTARALVRKGRRVPYDDLPGYHVSLRRPMTSLRPPTAVIDGSKLAVTDGCDAEDVERTPAVQSFRLDSDTSMMIVPWRCGNGAYNLYSNIIIVDGFGQAGAASFDYDNGVTGDGPSNVLVNAIWDADQRVLESFIKHRGIGDCGRIDRYIWGGEKFMLSEQLAMPECRGSFDRIRTWKVDVVDR